MMRKIELVLGCVLAAVAAAFFSIYAFGLTTPARDLNALLTPSPTATLRAQFRPTPAPSITATPAPANLIYAVDLTQAGDWPSSMASHYTLAGYLLVASPKSDFLAVPVPGFSDTSLQGLTIVAEAVPAAKNAAEYGVMFWHSTDRQGRERFLTFTITPQRTFRLRGYMPFTPTTGEKSYRWVDIVPETASRNIRIDGRPNRIQVQVQPSQIRVLINGYEVLSRKNGDIDNYRFRSDYDAKVGVIAIAPGDLDAQVEFTRFELYRGDLTR